jgi:NitT/TauT family transport system ATP-binding protein
VASPFSQPLPHVRIGGMSGLLELLAETSTGVEEVSHLADRLAVATDDLLAIIEAATLLGFARVASAQVTLTPLGYEFVKATILRSKDIFREQLIARVPIIDSIVRTLGERTGKSMRAEFFLDIWDEYFPFEEAQRQFATAVEWGRYAELFEYDSNEGTLYIEESHDDRIEPDLPLGLGPG